MMYTCATIGGVLLERGLNRSGGEAWGMLPGGTCHPVAGPEGSKTLQPMANRVCWSPLGQCCGALRACYRVARATR